MTTGNRSTFTPHIVVGFGFIFIGAVLALDRMGIVEASRSLQFWPVGLILIGAALVAQAARGSSQEPGASQPQFPTGAAMMLMIFVLVLARPFGKPDDGRQANERAKLVAVLGGDHRTSTAEPFRGAEMTAVMGGTVLDLRKATILPGEEAVVDVLTLMGGAVVRVPSDWFVDLRVTPVMGGVNDERRKSAESAVTAEATPSQPPAKPPRLVLQGFVMMGGVVVKN